MGWNARSARHWPRQAMRDLGPSLGPMERVLATRYVTAFREGGSLPGLMEADDLGMYVVKFTGAGQGRPALVAEVICAGIAVRLGLSVPRLVVVDLDPAIAGGEPDEEVQHLLSASPGGNLGVDFLPGALDLGPDPGVDPVLAGQVIWFDALVNNVDRSWRNPNLLRWHGRVFLIDHGAALTFQHAWPLGGSAGTSGGADAAGDSELLSHVARYAAARYVVGDHVLAGCQPDISAAETRFGVSGVPELIAAAVADVPQEWLDPRVGQAEVRDRFTRYLVARFDSRAQWLEELAADLAAGPSRADATRRVSARRGAGRPAWLLAAPGEPRGAS
jgi:hypothetical protein